MRSFSPQWVNIKGIEADCEYIKTLIKTDRVRALEQLVELQHIIIVNYEAFYHYGGDKADDLLDEIITLKLKLIDNNPYWK